MNLRNNYETKAYQIDADHFLPFLLVHNSRIVDYDSQ